MRHPQMFTLLLTLCPLGFGSSAALAAWPGSPLVNVPVCTASGAQVITALVGDGQGGFIALWDDERSGGMGVYAQRLNASGVTQWAPNGVPVVTGNSASAYPAAIPDGMGGAIVAWVDRRADADGDLYAQRIDANGVTQWSAGGVPVCTAAGFGQYADVVPDGAGGAVVVWMDQRTGHPTTSYAQRVSANGVPLWAPNGVPFAASANAFHFPSAVVADDSGGVIATWHGFKSAEITIPHPWAQRLDAAGQPRWGANGIPLAPPAGFSRYDIYHALVSDGAGGAVAVWADYDSKAIRAQRVNGLGAAQWPFDGVLVCSTTGERQPNRIQSDGAGGVLVPWSDYRVGGGDVYVQRISATGVPLWTPDGVATCTAGYVQVMPRLIPNGAGGALVAWSDYRGGVNWDVYAQNIGANGTLGGTTLGVVNAPDAAGLAVRCAGPNPQQGAFAVDCSLLEGDGASVSLFDVTGRCLESRSLSGLSAGTHRIAFAASLDTRSPGVYLVRLTQGGHYRTARMVLVR